AWHRSSDGAATAAPANASAPELDLADLTAHTVVAPPGSPITPDRLVVPRLGLDAPIAPVTMTADGTLQVPADPSEVGWWAEGAAPGAAQGTAILAGHVNTARRGPGAFARLNELEPGDEIVIIGGTSELRVHVQSVQRYPKDALPAQEVFSQEVPGRVALVSCAGLFDATTGHYRDNIVVHASAP
ncbi:MAG: class F sortase, partial [Acidimicrobiales bacterium]